MYKMLKIKFMIKMLLFFRYYLGIEWSNVSDDVDLRVHHTWRAGFADL